MKNIKDTVTIKVSDWFEGSYILEDEADLKQFKKDAERIAEKAYEEIDGDISDIGFIIAEELLKKYNMIVLHEAKLLKFFMDE